MEWGTIVSTVGIVAAVVAGIIIAVNRVNAHNEQEWKGLAESRGQRVDDLEHHIERLEGRIDILEDKYKALENLKVDMIADRVVTKIIETGLIAG